LKGTPRSKTKSRIRRTQASQNRGPPKIHRGVFTLIHKEDTAKKTPKGVTLEGFVKNRRRVEKAFSMTQFLAQPWEFETLNSTKTQKARAENNPSPLGGVINNLNVTKPRFLTMGI